MRLRTLMLASFLVSCAPPDDASTNDGEHVGSRALASGAFDGGPGRLGGGEDYGDWIDPADADHIVHDLDELEYWLDHTFAPFPTIIYVDDDALIQIDLGETLVIGPGVTLASGRGRNGSLGAMIFTSPDEDAQPKHSSFLVDGDDVRITGLRFRGPNASDEPPVACPGEDEHVTVGIHINGVANVEVDNNEMWAWPWTPVWAEGENNVVRHNHIHHNRREKLGDDGCDAWGFGYGVQADIGSTLIQANLFDHNRESVASAGWEGANYDAFHNLVLKDGLSQSFDCHGGADRNDGTDIACSTVNIKNNTVLQDESHAVLIRGRPTVMAEIFENEFLGSSFPNQVVVEQINALGNFKEHDNDFGIDKFPGWFVSLSGGFPGLAKPAPASSWFWRRFDTTSLASVELGNFNDPNGGGADALRSSNGVLWEISVGAKEDWRPWNVSGIAITDLAFGHMDSDKTLDAFAHWGGKWHFSPGASGTWKDLAGSTYDTHHLALGDFDGDAIDDVFISDGGKWLMSPSGVGSWANLNTSKIELKDLRFGRFRDPVTRSSDKITDVFRATGTEWQVSVGGTTEWLHLNDSEYELADLRFADFDGDAITDVFTVHNGEWLISYGGDTDWVSVNQSDYSISDLRFADVNGDGRSDVLVVSDGSE